MIDRLPSRFLSFVVLAGASAPASAHFFGRPYKFPVPYEMYVYGACAALALSFLLLAYFVRSTARPVEPRESFFSAPAWAAWIRIALQLLSVLLLFLCIATGWWGSRDPKINFNMTFFWLWFLLGFAYLSAVIGGGYVALNPVRALARGIGIAWRGYSAGRVNYPKRLAYWPALGFYYVLVWIELFHFNRPWSLSALLSAWLGLGLFGVWLVGARDWFRYCDVLGVYFRMFSLMAPVHYDADAESGRRWLLRAPFAGLLKHKPEHWSLLVFVLFMLSSTAYDGLRETVVWFRLFWHDPLQVLTPWLGSPPILEYVSLRPWYVFFESLCLLASPFLYLGAYLLCVWIGKRLAGSRRGVMELALYFGFSLLPIALVYNVTHYYSLLLSQGVKIISMASDPFGWGWDLFGTWNRFRAPILPSMEFYWNSQVALILFGHVFSVTIAHLLAIRAFPSSRAALLNQLPMLVLMMLFTGVGLWILAQPLMAG